MNPYEVLGISEDADEETIKKAYKSLVKKYHPDKYINNPLADLAAEKMKEINKAYDMLTRNKGAADAGGAGYGGTGYGSTGYGGYGQYQNIKPTFTLVRQMLSMHRPMQAIAMLQQLPRTAEWYFLSGVADINRGWSSQGIAYLEKAVEMEPGNQEYSDTLNKVRENANAYTRGSGEFQTGGDCCSGVPCWCIPCFCPGCGCC